MRQTLTALAGSVAGALFLSATPAGAVSYQLTHTFTPDNPAYAPSFGSALAFDDDVAVIKSESGYQDGNGLSVTHVFEQESSGDWIEAATLEFNSGDNEGNPFLGQEIAIDNGEIVIGYGVYFREPEARYLQFATRDAGDWSVDLNAPSPEAIFSPFGSFGPGRSVDISGSIAVVEDRYSLREGLARIYEKSAQGLWIETDNIGPFTDFSPGSVAIDGTTVVLADWGANSGLSVRFYGRNTSGDWVEEPAEEVSSIVGTNVDIDGETAVVHNLLAGTLSILQRSTGAWRVSETITSEFNRGSDIEGGIVAAAFSASRIGPDRVDLIHQTLSGDWEVFASIDDPNPDASSSFGSRLALDGGRLLVTGESPDGNDVVYLFEPVPEPASAALFAMLGVAGLCRRRRA